MQALLQDFIKNPTQDLAAYTAKIQGVYDSLPSSSDPLTRIDRRDV